MPRRSESHQEFCFLLPILARFPARSHRDFCHREFPSLAAGIFASRRESWQDLQQDPGKILAAGIFASRQESWRDSRQEPGEILAARNFASQRESCREKNPGGQNLAGVPGGIPAEIPVLILQGHDTCVVDGVVSSTQWGDIILC